MKRVSEIEKKYLIANFSEAMIPPGMDFQGIFQVYLDRHDRPDTECRVRRISARDGKSYSYTEKKLTKVAGVREEAEEEQISASRYEQLIDIYDDKKSMPVRKRRYRIPRGEHVLELDVYEGPLSGLVILEVEFLSEEAMNAFVLPEDFCGIDVTADKRYSNRALARDGMPRE